jgi:hypothetical protein
MYLQESEYEGVDRIHMDQVRIQSRDLDNMVMDLP